MLTLPLSRVAEQYVKEYRQKSKDEIRLKRVAKNAGNFYVEPEAKVVFAVRIRGINRVSPKTTKVAHLLPSSMLASPACSAAKCLAAGCCAHRLHDSLLCRFCSCCACARCTMACSSRSTRP